MAVEGTCLIAPGVITQVKKRSHWYVITGDKRQDYGLRMAPTLEQKVRVRTQVPNGHGESCLVRRREAAKEKSLRPRSFFFYLYGQVLGRLRNVSVEVAFVYRRLCSHE